MVRDQVNGRPDRPYREFGAWLRDRRLARRLTQSDLAGQLAYEVSYVRKVEWGTRRPSAAFLARVAQVFDLPAAAVPSPEFGAGGPRLPVPATAMIGRREDTESVVLFLESHRLVTLLGAPGIGKTRIAIEVAKVCDARLEHGSTFVALDAVTAAVDVPAAIARALGLAAPVRAGEQAVIDHLRPRTMLLVCDNLEHVLDARSFLAEIIACAPGVRILATSREPLRLAGEARYPVPSLAFPDPDALPPLATLADWPAIALFQARARLVQPDFSITVDNARAVTAICAGLDGLALAIELAASTMGFFTSEALLDRLDRIDDLPVSSPSDVPKRQQEMTAAIDWSFERLTAAEQAVLGRLSVFAGGFSREAAAAVCSDADDGPEPRGTAGIVACLIEKSLVGTRTESGGVRLLLLEVIRQYACDRLDERGESDRLRRRHAEHYAGWVRSIEPGLTGVDQARRLAELDNEQANLHAGFQWAVDRDPALALRFCASTWRWWMRRHVAEGRRWFDAALTASADLSGGEIEIDRVKVLNGAGVLSATLGQYDAALSFLGDAMGLANELGLDDARAIAHLHTGIVAEARGQYQDASSHFEGAADLYRSLGDLRGLAHALNALAAVATDTGENERATILYEQSLDAFRRLGDRWSEALVTANLGWSALALDRPRRAEAWYDQSLVAWREVGDERGVAMVLAGSARAGRQLGAPPRVVAGRLEEALLLLAKVGDRRGAAECLEELAAVAGDTGEWGRAGVLVAAAGTQRRVTSVPLSPCEQGRFASLIDQVRAHLDPAEFEAASAEGEAIGLDQAVALVLRPSVSPTI